MSHAPARLTELGAYWESQGGRMLGIVGNAAHVVGYHLGRDRIYDGSGPGRGDNDYSVQHARDKAGLTNAASAIDLGRLDGSYKGLRQFSRWLVDYCQSSSSARRDIREIIYSPDGERVMRYSGLDNQIHTGPGNGDSSHLTHTHISYFRDSQQRDKTYVFRPYFELPPEDAMPQFTVSETPLVALVKEDPTRPGNSLWMYTTSALKKDGKELSLSPIRPLPLVGILPGDVAILAYEPSTPDPDTRSLTYYIAQGELASITPAPTVPKDCTNEIEMAILDDRAKARIVYV